MTEPFVSIVTPFYNAAPWLAECVESVLAQTHRRFEYVLLDNASTDGSAEIAQRFAAQDSRIRLTRNSELLPQVPNYNKALSLISPESQYCKIVQADDFIFPDCIRAMVKVFETSPKIGLVCSYFLKGALVRGYGLPYGTPHLPGHDVAVRLLRDGLFVFGSPSAHMYRSSVVRSRQPFYTLGRLHEDTEACLEILREWDCGFVFQVLSFLRVGNESITSRVKFYGPKYADRYITVRRYAPIFFEPDDAEPLRRDVKDFYYSFLAGSVLKFRRRDFWDYHRRALSTVNETLDVPYLTTRVLRKLAWWAINPGVAILRVFRKGVPIDIPD